MLAPNRSSFFSKEAREIREQQERDAEVEARFPEVAKLRACLDELRGATAFVRWLQDNGHLEQLSPDTDFAQLVAVWKGLDYDALTKQLPEYESWLHAR